MNARKRNWEAKWNGIRLGGMCMKKRLTVAGVVLILAGTFLLPIIALDVHAILSRDMDMLSYSPIDGWAAIVALEQVRLMYLLLVATLMLMLLWAIVSSSTLNYRSDMQQITPKISTPCAAGQGQYGTAKWLPKDEYRECFKEINVQMLLSKVVKDPDPKEEENEAERRT